MTVSTIEAISLPESLINSPMLPPTNPPTSLPKVLNTFPMSPLPTESNILCVALSSLFTRPGATNFNGVISAIILTAVLTAFVATLATFCYN